MRDPKRIDRMLALLRRVWTQNPDWRLGQLVSNSAPGLDPIFYVDDDKIEARMNELARPDHPAAADQPAPAGEGTDVILDLVEKWSEVRRTNIGGLVNQQCADLGWGVKNALLARREKGIATYGVPLRTRNGRNARVDCAQELLDALIYAWQAKLEGEGK